MLKQTGELLIILGIPCLALIGIFYLLIFSEALGVNKDKDKN